MIDTDFGDWDHLNELISGERIESNSLVFYPNCFSDYIGQLNRLAGIEFEEQLQAFPIVVSVYLGNDCRDNCKGCFAHTYVKKGLSEPIRSKKDIIEELVDLGITHFKFGGGGDPLTGPHLEEVLEAVHKNSAKSVLITNGDMISDERIPILGSKVTNFRFSGNAYNKELHQLINRPSAEADDFDKRIEQVTKIVKLRRMNNLISGTTYLANPSVPGSIEGIEKYLGMAINIGFDYFVVRYVFYFTPHTAESTREIDKKMKVLQKQLVDKIKIIVPPRIEYEAKTDFMILLKTTIDYSNHIHPCPNGGIYFNTQSFGCLDTSSFKEIWLGNIRRDFIRRHLNPFPSFNYCSKCNYGARNSTYNWIADKLKNGETLFSQERR